MIHWIKSTPDITFFHEHKCATLVIPSISFYGHYKSDEVLIFFLVKTSIICCISLRAGIHVLLLWLYGWMLLDATTVCLSLCAAGRRANAAVFERLNTNRDGLKQHISSDVVHSGIDYIFLFFPINSDSWLHNAPGLLEIFGFICNCAEIPGLKSMN